MAYFGTRGVGRTEEGARKYADKSARIAHMFGLGADRKVGMYATMEGNQEYQFKGANGVRLNDFAYLSGLIKLLAQHATSRRQKTYGAPYRSNVGTPEDPINQGSNSCIDFDLSQLAPGIIIVGTLDLSGYIVRVGADVLLSLTLGTVDVIPFAPTTGAEATEATAAAAPAAAWEVEPAVTPVTRRTRRSNAAAKVAEEALAF